MFYIIAICVNLLACLLVLSNLRYMCVGLSSCFGCGNYSIPPITILEMMCYLTARVFLPFLVKSN